MIAEPATDPRQRTDRFRLGAQLPALLGLIASALLFFVLVAVMYGPGFDPNSSDPVWADLAIVFLGAHLGIAIWLLRRRPVMLQVGPDGLHVPFGWRRPLAWSDIHRVRRCRRRKLLFEVSQWLEVDPAPGVLPDYKLPGPRRLEAWLISRRSIRIPISKLIADPETVVASVERFRPVIRAFR